MVGKMKTGLEQGLQVFKKWPAQKPEKVYMDAIRARGFVGVFFR
jgi:hypothetical protein